MERTIDLVISRFNENLEWFKDSTPYRRVFLYNKGLPFTYPGDNVNIIDLPNVGRVDHTYLHHIIENYDTLADVTLFLPGSCDLPNKRQQMQNTITYTLEKKDAYFQTEAVPDDIHTFSLNSWTSTSNDNKILNDEHQLAPASPKPFGIWYETYFNTQFSSSVVYLGIFSVRADQIRLRPKTFYEQLITCVNHHSNPEAGHYIERAWYSMFHKNPTLTYAICVCTESRELDDLLSCLKNIKDEHDDIHILVDAGKATEDVRRVIASHNATFDDRVFCGNFATHRNFQIGKCTGDYIFMIDADEIPQEILIRNIKRVISETRADIIYVPRMNIIPGYTYDWLEKHQFHINEVGFINWPDYQGRVFMNNGIITWKNALHEKLDGGIATIVLQPLVEMGLWHIKSIKKQTTQGDFYNNLSAS